MKPVTHFAWPIKVRGMFADKDQVIACGKKYTVRLTTNLGKVTCTKCGYALHHANINQPRAFLHNLVMDKVNYNG